MIIKFLFFASTHKLIIVFGLISLIVGMLGQNYLTFEIVLDNLINIRSLVDQFRFKGAILYIFLYCLIVMLSIPGASLLTIVSGYIFGGFIGGIIAVIGALSGASMLFFIVRAGLRLDLQRRLRSSPMFGSISKEIYENQIRYLLFLRIFPFFPFWMVNLVPPVLGVKFLAFFLTTLFGILPGTFIIAGIGQKLRIISAPSEEFVYQLFLDPQFIFFVSILSIILILPRILKFQSLKNVGKEKS